MNKLYRTFVAREVAEARNRRGISNLISSVIKLARGENLNMYELFWHFSLTVLLLKLKNRTVLKYMLVSAEILKVAQPLL